MFHDKHPAIMSFLNCFRKNTNWKAMNLHIHLERSDTLGSTGNFKVHIAGEIFGLRLLSLHNLYFLEEFVRRMRQSIIDGKFTQFRSESLANYKR